MSRKLYLSVRVFSHDSEIDAPYIAPVGRTIDESTAEFANMANATAVFEDCAAPLVRAMEKGVHRELERVKPGKRPVLVAEPEKPTDGSHVVMESLRVEEAKRAAKQQKATK